MEKEKSVVLCSGGFDSIVLLNDLVQNPLYEVNVLFFDYGQKSVNQEYKCVKRWTEYLGVDGRSMRIHLPVFSWANTSMTGNSEVRDYTDRQSQYVPMRNLIFLSYALSYAQSIGARNIFMALLGGGTYPDTTSDFLYNMNQIASDIGINIITPFESHDKMFLFSRAVKYGVFGKNGTCNFFSCNTPVNGKPCGMCDDCKVISEMQSLINGGIIFNKPLDDLGF